MTEALPANSPRGRSFIALLEVVLAALLNPGKHMMTLLTCYATFVPAQTELKTVQPAEFIELLVQAGGRAPGAAPGAHWQGDGARHLKGHVGPLPRPPVCQHRPLQGRYHGQLRSSGAHALLFRELLPADCVAGILRGA